MPRAGQQLPPNVTVRPLRAGDIASLADLLAAAPDDGSLYQFPHILSYPGEMRRLHRGWLRPTLYDPTTLIRIAVLSAEEQGDKIIGFSSWQKREADETSETGATRLVCIDIAAPPSSNDDAGAADAAGSEGDDASSSSSSSSGSGKALTPNPQHTAAVKRVRKRLPRSPTLTTPCYELNGLAVHPGYQGLGVGSLLVCWGLERAAADGLPVFTTGDAGGVDFYEKALGFQRLRGSEYWLDADGQDIGEEEEDKGEGEGEAWKKGNGGLSGAEMVWCPKATQVDVRGHVYRG